MLKILLQLSHSSVHHLRNHSRNVDDEVLAALKKNNGVIHIVAFRSYLKPAPRQKMAYLNQLAKKYQLPKGDIWSEGDRIFSAIRKKSKSERVDYFKQLKAIDHRHTHATVKDLVDHIDYVVKKIGVNHVGISSDFGGGGGVTGWNDASETFNITRELVLRGYSEDEIQKIWSGNLLRVWRDVEKAAH